MENREEIVKELLSLVHLDIDAIFAYEAAIENVSIASVRDIFSQFKEDHERHVKELSALIERCGAPVPKVAPDLKGYIIEGLTRIRSSSGTVGALKAMHGNEIFTNYVYEGALTLHLPVEFRKVIEKNKMDEHRHLGLIKNLVEEKAWEPLAEAAS